MKYQFQLDNRPAGPVRNEWEEAAADAVRAGYATWVSYKPAAIHLDDTQGATINRLNL